MDLTAEQLSSERRSATRPGSAGHGDRERFRFHGKAGEYFRIWIVNLSLTILTLGIYSAWAKVRRNRYIYGNLELAGSRFDYLARPATILRGRLIALTLVGLYLGAQIFFSIGWVLLSVLLGLTIPWLLVRSRMFNMRYTAYRNIRFGFRPAYADSYKVVIGYGALSLITIGLAAPYVHYRRNHLIVDNTRFGNMNFRLHARVREFYLAYVLGAVLASALFVPLQVLGGESGAAGGGLPQLPITVLLPFLAVILLYYVVGQFVNAYVLRLTMNGTRIDTGGSGRPHVLGCDWTLAGMLCVYLTNAIAIALSLGLLVPWAQMRILRYQLNHTWLDVSETLDDVIAGQDPDISSVGEEIGDLFDVDIGL